MPLKDKEKRRIYNREYHCVNKEKRNARKRERERILKLDVLTHYGNGKCACVVCGFQDIRALSIDHIAGGGNKFRRQANKKGGYNFYKWLIDHSLPPGYQTLCMNCQWIKR